MVPGCRNPRGEHTPVAGPAWPSRATGTPGGGTMEAPARFGGYGARRAGPGWRHPHAFGRVRGQNGVQPLVGGVGGLSLGSCCMDWKAQSGSAARPRNPSSCRSAGAHTFLLTARAPPLLDKVPRCLLRPGRTMAHGSAAGTPDVRVPVGSWPLKQVLGQPLGCCCTDWEASRGVP
jgi:hypothetical protein